MYERPTTFQEMLISIAKERRKLDKIEHYLDRPLNTFLQYDGFLPEQTDGIITPDEDGYGACFGVTEECMYGPPVRILIKKDTDKTDVLRLLNKLTKWIETEDFKQRINEYNSPLSPHDLPF